MYDLLGVHHEPLEALRVSASRAVPEMVGGDEQAATLAAIDKGVARLNARFDLDDDAKLRTAEQTIRRSSGSNR